MDCNLMRERMLNASLIWQINSQCVQDIMYIRFHPSSCRILLFQQHGQDSVITSPSSTICEMILYVLYNLY